MICNFKDALKRSSAREKAVQIALSADNIEVIKM